MIGKFITGKSLGGCLRYCLHDKLKTEGEELVMKDRAEVILYNQCGGTEMELLWQFNDVRQLNPKLAKPALHIILNLAPGEMLSKDKLMELSEDCARELGFANNQFVAVLHKDTQHQHLHIVVNRVGFDRKTVSDSNSYRRMADCCRKLELKHNLKQVLSPRPFLPETEKLLPRHDSRRETLKSHIQQSLQVAGSYREFEAKMQELGYQVLKARGIAFIDNKQVRIKGSEVGFPLQKIEKIFELKQQLFKEQTLEAMSRSNSPAITNTTVRNHHNQLSKRGSHQPGFMENLEQLLSHKTQHALQELLFGSPHATAPDSGPAIQEWLKKKKKKKRKI